MALDSPLVIPAGPIGAWTALVSPYGNSEAIKTALVVTAADVSYTPADPNDWGSPPPATAQAALDNLADGPAFQFISNAGAFGPAPSYNFDSAPVQPVRSGRYLFLVWASLTQAASTALVTITQRLDGATTGNPGTQAVTNAGAGILSLGRFEAVNKAVTHTWGIGISAAAGNSSAAIGALRILLMEF